jgi:hypothetical protein
MTQRHPYIRQRSNDYDSQVKCFDVSNILIWENELDEGIGKHNRWPFAWGSLLHEYLSCVVFQVVNSMSPVVTPVRR